MNVVSHWSASAWVLVPCAAVAAAHVLGVRGLLADAPRGGRRRSAGLGREAVVFWLGLLAVILALVSPIGYWAQRFVWVRSVQDALLAVVAPALVVLGAPWLALRRALPRRLRAQERRPEGRRSEGARGWYWLPIAVTAGFNVVWCGWHVPVLYGAARAQPAVFACEVLTYLGTGVLFWLQLIGSRPQVPMLVPLRRVALVVAAAVVGSGLGMVLVFGSRILYPEYAGGEHRALGLVADQQLGGAVLWVVALIPYAVAIVALLVAWLKNEESADLATSLDRLLMPAKPAWPSRPGLK